MSPSVIFGATLAVIAIFFLGYRTAHFVLDSIAGRRKTTATRLPPALTDSGIDRISIALGVLLVGLAALLLFTVPSQWAVGTWIALTGLGFVIGLVSLIGWGKNDNAGSRDATIQAKPASGEPATPPRYRSNGAESGKAKPAGASAIQPDEAVIVPCPNCSQKLRVPRRKRQLIITCPRCRYSFPYNTSEDTPV